MWRIHFTFHHANYQQKNIKTHLSSNSCALLFPTQTHPSHLKRLASSTFRQEKGGETPFVRYGETKTTGKPFWKPFFGSTKKCHCDAIVSRFSLKKTKRIYLVWKVKNTSTNSVAGCVFLFGKSPLVFCKPTAHIATPVWSFSETRTVADVRMIYG